MTRIINTVYIMLAGDYKQESHAVAKETPRDAAII